MKAINEMKHPHIPRIFDWQQEEQPQEQEQDVYFNREVLDKYVGHPYVSFGPDQDENGYCERLRFINQLQSAQSFAALKGLPFYCKWVSPTFTGPCFNHTVGMPFKNGIQHELYDYEYELFEYLERDEPTDPKNRHIFCLKSGGLGVTDFLLRYIGWICTRDDSHRGHKIAVIVGPRLELATTLIDRLKRLFIQKGLVNNFDTRSTTAIINGCEIGCYPSHRMDDLRGMTDLDMIIADEADFLIESQQANLLDVMERYIPKTNPILCLVSTPNKPDGLFARLQREPDDKSIYKKFYFPYTRGLGKIYSEQEIAIAKQSHNFDREFNLRFGGLIGNTFNVKSIDAAIDRGRNYDPEYLDPYHFHAGRSMGIDPAYGSSNFGIVVTEFVDGIVRVMYCEEFERPDYVQMLDTVYSVMSKYQVDLTYVDGANPSFIKSLKLLVGDKSDYLSELDRAKREGFKVSSIMKIIPVNFNSEHKAMLGHCKTLLDKGHIAINPDKFDKSIVALRTAVDEDGTLDKETYPDVIKRLLDFVVAEAQRSEMLQTKKLNTHSNNKAAAEEKKTA
jgi:hypothetical protein